MDKFIKRSMLTFACIFFVIGALGVVDGVRSLIGGGYADSIVLGAIIMFGCSLPCLFMYAFIKEVEKR